MSQVKLILKDGTELMLDAIKLPEDLVKVYASKDAFISTWNMLTDENLSEMSAWYSDTQTLKMTGYTIDSVQAVTNSDGTVTGHFYLRDGSFASVVTDNATEQEKEETLKKVSEFGGFHTEIKQSDRLGFDWREEWLGLTLLSRTYVEQDDPAGTENHPIEWMDGITLIENAYYIKPDGLLYVCKNGGLTLF